MPDENSEPQRHAQMPREDLDTARKLRLVAIEIHKGKISIANLEIQQIKLNLLLQRAANDARVPETELELAQLEQGLATLIANPPPAD